MNYPALHNDASISSYAAQWRFLNLVRLEYGALLLISFGYLWLPSTPQTHIAMMLAVVVALAAAGYRTWKKPEEDWYQFRALAESVKTLTWRYAMQAEPFDKTTEMARAEFRNALRELLSVNAALGPKFESYGTEADQITSTMTEARELPLAERVRIYGEQRIHDQRLWYARKAAANRKAGRRWFAALVGAYLLLLAILALRISYPDWTFLAPDPVLVIASSIIGWMQVKKFTDLAAAYQITAQEIGIAASELAEVSDRQDRFAAFVLSCEQVFSREHTQWVARRRS